MPLIDDSKKQGFGRSDQPNARLAAGRCFPIGRANILILLCPPACLFLRCAWLFVQGEKGICVIAGDISPIDVISHVPIFCEQKDVAYVYVPSKQDLGAAANTKRPTSVVLVQCKKGFEEKELFDKALGEVQKAMPDFK